MKIEIYGIEEADYRCYGCELVKRVLDDNGLKYDFKRIITRGQDGNPEYVKDVMDELRTKIHFSKLSLPYIFFDGQRVLGKDFRTTLEGLGYNYF